MKRIRKSAPDCLILPVNTFQGQTNLIVWLDVDKYVDFETSCHGEAHVWLVRYAERGQSCGDVQKGLVRFTLLTIPDLSNTDHGIP
jgi:hypothetical protein